MKLHKIASELLVGLLDDYVVGFDPAEVTVLLLSGKCILTNVKLKVRNIMVFLLFSSQRQV